MPGTLHLVADIGGTKTLMALATPDGLTETTRRENDSSEGFLPLLQVYLDNLPPLLRDSITGASLAVAGPLHGDHVALSNRPGWVIDKAAVSALLDHKPVHVLNDFAAAVRGLPELADEDLHTLQAGVERPAGLRLCLGPGTGFGVAALHEAHVIPSEGGHIAFAPIDHAQVELWRFLGGEYRRVTLDRVCSGPGLVATYRHCLHRAGHAIDGELSPARVIARARKEGDANARQALELFTRILGAACGDLALAFLATGGVYLTGGMALHLLPEISRGGFMRAFNRKAEHGSITRRIPLHLVLRDDLALLGAASFAREQACSTPSPGDAHAPRRIRSQGESANLSPT